MHAWLLFSLSSATMLRVAHRQRKFTNNRAHIEENWSPQHVWPDIHSEKCNADDYMQSMLHFLNSSRSRHINNPGIYQAEDYILHELKQSGMPQAFKQKFTVGGTDVYNIVAFLQGQTDGFFIVGAHHDTMPKGDISPGVDDNASGTVDLLLIAKMMAKIPIRNRKFSTAFVSFSAEEEGLLGSQAFRSGAWFQNRAHDFQGALILDQLGSNLKRGDTFIFETKKASGTKAKVELVLSALSASVLPGSQPLVDYEGWGSDHISFLDAGFPAVLVISAANRQTAEKFGHTQSDDIENLNATFAANACSLVATATSLLISGAEPTKSATY